jgi:hypothetical protein
MFPPPSFVAGSFSCYPLIQFDYGLVVKKIKQLPSANPLMVNLSAEIFPEKRRVHDYKNDVSKGRNSGFFSHHTPA